MGLEKEARKVILGKMEHLEDISKEAVVEMIRPHYSFDHIKALDKELKREADYLIAKVRDENGQRRFFTYKDSNGKSAYVNVDETENLSKILKVKKRLHKQFQGLRASREKVSRRQREVSEQLSLWGNDDLRV